MSTPAVAKAGPYTPPGAPISVVVTATPVAGTTAGGTAVVRMQPNGHDHLAGTECAACAAQHDIRARLFDLLEAVRQGHRPSFSRVVVDASALPDPSDVLDRLIPGRVPARGLRDHTVLRSFRLHLGHSGI